MDRLFIYGSLQPGGPNAHELASIEGEWEPAIIRGRLVDGGWGANLGYPGLVVDADGIDVHGYVFSSSHLRSEWNRLDKLEGADYVRTTTPVALADGKIVQAHVYVLRA